MSKYKYGKDYKRNREIVLARDGHICAYCNGPADQTDHLVARANGGDSSLSNLVACCASCNNLKSDKVLMRKQYKNERYFKNESTV